MNVKVHRDLVEFEYNFKGYTLFGELVPVDTSPHFLVYPNSLRTISQNGTVSSVESIEIINYLIKYCSENNIVHFKFAE